MPPDSSPATTSIFDFFVKFGDFFCGIPQNFVVKFVAQV
jgi:hypothetical protein